MRILYGVCGEGFGHSSRAKEIIAHLKSKGHEVLVLTYGQAYPVLKEFFPVRIDGIELIFEKNKLSLEKTISQNIPKMLNNLWEWQHLKLLIDNFSPEICISDMEPLVPIISFWRKLPLISIDNQHRLTHIIINVPKRYKRGYLVAKYAVNTCISRAEAFIILSFTKEKTKKKNAHVVSPILRKQFIELKSTKGKHILVYQTKKDEELIKILKKIPEKFIVYGYDKEKKENNIEYKKTGSDFLENLASAKAVIATSGFTLMSEALFLKKPYFAIPLQGQFEQVLNSLFLKKAGFGNFSEKPTKEQLENFLKNLPKYEKALKKHKFNPNDAIEILDRLLGEIGERKIYK